jgi:hypothetical protein
MRSVIKPLSLKLFEMKKPPLAILLWGAVVYRKSSGGCRGPSSDIVQDVQSRRERTIMRAIKLQTRVRHDRTLSIQLPEDVEEGLAEVIVLVSEQRPKKRISLQEFLAELSRHPRRARSREEIDTELRRERESWD